MCIPIQSLNHSPLVLALQEQFIGKKAEIKIFERDNFGKQYDKKLISVSGIVEWIGQNELWPDKIQVNISRVPFTINHINDIKLL